MLRGCQYVVRDNNMETLLTETEAELVARNNAFFVEVSVVYIESFWVVVVTADDCSAVIGCLFCDGVRKFATGRGRTVQDVDETIAGLLTR